MSDLDVRIEELEPMRVASVRAVSENPEHDAWEKLKSWADAKGYLENVEEHPIFGFNNPNPEVWMSLSNWVQSNSYEWRKTNELEKQHDPLGSHDEMTFDLYLPIVK